MRDIEKKWQRIWLEEKAFAATNDSDKPKYYVLEMLHYPSGKIHVGHLRNYSIGDFIARFMKSQGYNHIFKTNKIKNITKRQTVF